MFYYIINPVVINYEIQVFSIGAYWRYSYFYKDQELSVRADDRQPALK